LLDAYTISSPILLSALLRGRLAPLSAKRKRRHRPHLHLRFPEAHRKRRYQVLASAATAVWFRHLGRAIQSPCGLLQISIAGSGPCSTSRIAVAVKLVANVFEKAFTALKSILFRVCDLGLNMNVGMSKSLA